MGAVVPKIPYTNPTRAPHEPDANPTRAQPRTRYYSRYAQPVCPIWAHVFPGRLNVPPAARGERLFRFLGSLVLHKLCGTAIIRFDGGKVTHVETETLQEW